MTEEMLDHHFLKRESLVYRPLLRLETWLDHAAPVIFTSSDHAGRLLLAQFGCNPARVHALPDCVNADVFKPASDYDPLDLAILRGQLGIPPERRLIVYLGLLAAYQGTGLLLEALARVVARQPEAHLLLMGFPDVDLYRQQADALGIGNHVTFTGRVPYQQAPAHLALGDVAVAPKLSLTEGSGKLLNYMAVGLPVVAFDTPVAREYLGSDGLLASRGNVDDLAEKLLLCLFPASDEARIYQAMGDRLRQRAIQHFSWDAAGRQILESYQVLLGDRRVGTLRHSQREHPVTW